MIDKLAILWTTSDPDVAQNMILMYALKANQNHWWKECTLISWGPSNKLLCQDPGIQEAVQSVQAAGVDVYACRRCAERYGLVDQLESMGIQVQLMGEPLTRLLQDPDCRVVSL